MNLWFRYLRGEQAALRDLLDYNFEDTASLVVLAGYAHRHLSAKAGVGTKTRQARKLSLPVANGEVSSLWKAAIRSGPPKTERFNLDTLFDVTGRDVRVVGIDLTGSEKKPSGWALLTGNVSTTALIASDDELIDATLATRPAVVSIDSPLSVPPGTEIGEDGSIVRYERAHRASELELRRRGVHLYWCLLPSMQALTLRGMRLASAMRARGLRVIESFPGGAQDILGLPRKQAGVDGLNDALTACGLDGIPRGSVSHDELDAVTSALVGLFYLAGRYEALGDEDCDSIVPATAEAGRCARPALP